MFLQLNHQRLDVYNVARSFVLECYKLTGKLPPEEKFGLVSQIRRAALSVHPNIAEGASRKSTVERKRFYEIARGSIVEVDAALDVAKDLDYIQNYPLDKLGHIVIQCFKMVSGMINK